MVSFTRQVPNIIIFGYEIILAFEIKAFKVKHIGFSNILFYLFTLFVIFSSL
jgi:hypothetical protein